MAGEGGGGRGRWGVKWVEDKKSQLTSLAIGNGEGRGFGSNKYCGRAGVWGGLGSRRRSRHSS